jgi:hypothetical protein
MRARSARGVVNAWRKVEWVATIRRAPAGMWGSRALRKMPLRSRTSALCRSTNLDEKNTARTSGSVEPPRRYARSSLARPSGARPWVRLSRAGASTLVPTALRAEGGGAFHSFPSD